MKRELLATVLLSGPLFATDYLTPDQAARGMFPQADLIEPFAFTPGSGFAAFRGQVLVAKQGGKSLGHVVIDNVMGRSERITLAVGVGTDGAVRRVEILSYRESHGQEVRMPAWRRQFEGKTAAAPLAVGRDIAPISGATISSNSVTDGVRRALAMLKEAREAGRLP
ncbi:FMN-binding protein [Geothrix sp. 21YS21S-4]|uniref:FMN-binding protein n=1 Tax=Geothrix sp. 21YS21S-4 TaxID=3068889 RepID=UPI0027B99290|nr:FMN-binding protein [Geothrix sp. 21YS21S-4]